MNHWLVLHVLFAALCLTGAEPTAEECEKLLTPLSLADKLAMLGEGSLLLGFVDHKAFSAVMGVTQSSKINMTVEDDHVVMSESLKMNGTCYRLTVNLTNDDIMVKMAIANMTSTYFLLPTCHGCFTLSGNSTGKNFKAFLRSLNLDVDIEDEVSTKGLYLYSKDLSLKDEDRERFMNQAACLGFSGEPDFKYNPDDGFCAEGEGVVIPS